MFRHKSRFAICAVWFMALLPVTLSAQPNHQTGTLLGIERKVTITPMTYVFDRRGDLPRDRHLRTVDPGGKRDLLH